MRAKISWDCNSARKPRLEQHFHRFSRPRCVQALHSYHNIYQPTEHVGRKALVSISLCHRILSHFHSLTTPREQDKEATVYIGNLDERVTDSLVLELMLQAGRIVNVHLPKDRVTQTHQGYGFVEFISEEDAEYAAKIMNQVRLYGKPIRVNKASADKQKTVEVGAELFIGNLDPMVDEKTLYDTFSRFGSLISAPKVASSPPPFSLPSHAPN